MHIQVLFSVDKDMNNFGGLKDILHESYPQFNAG